MKKMLLLAISSLLFQLSPAQIFITNPNDIAIKDKTNASPYPSVITVSNLPTKVKSVQISFTMTHTFPDDVDILLVGPQGQSTIVMSDCGGNTNITNAPFIITDSATNFFPDNGSLTVGGIFKPTNFETNIDVWFAPAPAAPYGTNFAVFTNTNPNGDWKLFIVDDALADTGLVTQWTLNLTIQPKNDFTGDNVSDYILKKGKKLFIVAETNVLPITKTTMPALSSFKAKIVGGADLDGDHISDLIVKKGKTVQGLKGPGFTSPIYTLEVKRLKPVASGDFNGDLLPDLYFQKKTSLLVATNTGSGFSAPFIVADKTLPKKFKIFGALSGRNQPAVVAQKGTDLVRIDGPSFNSPTLLISLSSKRTKAAAIGQFIFDGTGATTILQQKKVLSFNSPFLPDTIVNFITNEVKGAKVVAPR